MTTNNVIGTPGIFIADTFSTAGGYPLSFTLTGSTSFTLPTSGTILSDASPTIDTPNITGVTDGSDAAAGSVGEYVSSTINSGSAVSLITNTPKTIVSINLGPGNWDMWGNVIFSLSGVSSLSLNRLGINVVTNVLPSVFAGNANLNYLILRNIDNSIMTLNTGIGRISNSTTTIYYLVAEVTYSGGSVSGYGSIQARRVR